MIQMYRCCSRSFFQQHFFEIFGPSYSMTMNGIHKNRMPGPLRSNIERQTIVDYTNKCREKVLNLGIVTLEGDETKDEEVNRISNHLRSKYLTKKVVESK